ncbi:RNA ligase family protein [Polymorphospora rubra]|uniref:RNA ligase family protein n=1 Tax=Polymorphospora rubra TaxID=338584 RepID=UPI0033CB19D5
MVRVQHIPYPKIGTISARDAAGPWIAAEKIHGAQLVVATDGRTTRVGKRKAWLRDGDPFFGWQLLRDRLVAAAHAALPGPGAAVRLYGELYGGAYPHPDVPPAPGVTAVQTGIWYSPDLRFALFDILVQNADDEEGTYLPFAQVREVAAVAGLDVVPLLGRGRRQDLDTVPTRFVTTIPDSLGLPPLPGNLAEGVVLRADRTLPPGKRSIVKHKIAEFDEQRFDDSRPFDASAPLTLTDLFAIAGRMANPIRLASARSKVGVNQAAIADEAVLDVLIDLTNAFPTAMAQLDHTADSALQKHVRHAIRIATIDGHAGSADDPHHR